MRAYSGGIVWAMPDEKPEKEPSKLDERVAIPLDPEEALKALLKVDPEAEPVEDDPAPPHGDPLRRSRPH